MGESSEDIAANRCGSEVSGLGSGKAHDVRISKAENRGGTKGKMGGGSGEIATNRCGSEVDDLGPSKAQNFGTRQEKNGCGITCTLGGVPSGEEESGLVVWGACCGEFAVGFHPQFTVHSRSGPALN